MRDLKPYLIEINFSISLDVLVKKIATIFSSIVSIELVDVFDDVFHVILMIVEDFVEHLVRVKINNIKIGKVLFSNDKIIVLDCKVKSKVSTNEISILRNWEVGEEL